MTTAKISVSIEQRLKDAVSKFEVVKSQREENLKLAEESLNEMTLLQGEYRALQSLLEESKPVNKEATVIDAVPEEERVES